MTTVTSIRPAMEIGPFGIRGNRPVVRPGRGARQTPAPGSGVIHAVVRHQAERNGTQVHHRGNGAEVSMQVSVEESAGPTRPGAPDAPMPRFDAFRLDTVNEYLWHAGVPIDLTPKAFAVLRYLVEHPGRLVTPRELLDALWPDVYVQPEIVKTYIRDIRKILGDRPKAPRFIETRPRRGYRFVAAVTDESGTLPAASASSPHGRPWALQTHPTGPGPSPASPSRRWEEEYTQPHPGRDDGVGLARLR